MDRLLEAIDFAAKKHINQRRKNNNASPYINHPIDVMNTLSHCGVTDINTLMAAVLHDTIEDTNTTFDEIKNKFGDDVAKIVMECTDDKSLPKDVRKKEQIKHAATISTSAKLVKLADKYSNLRDLATDPPKSWADTEIKGYAIWSYAVFLNLAGVNKTLENKLISIFEQFDILTMSSDELNDALVKYYDNMVQSE